LLTGFPRTNEEEERMHILNCASAKDIMKLYKGQRCLAAFCSFKVWTAECI